MSTVLDDMIKSIDRTKLPKSRMDIARFYAFLLKAAIESKDKDPFQFGWMILHLLYDNPFGEGFNPAGREDSSERKICYEKLKKGEANNFADLRSKMPSWCPKPIVDIMIQCCPIDPLQRPSLKDIIAELKYYQQDWNIRLKAVVDPLDIPTVTPIPSRIYKAEEMPLFRFEFGNIIKTLYIDDTLIKTNGIFECLYGDSIVSRLKAGWDRKAGYYCPILFEKEIDEMYNKPKAIQGPASKTEMKESSEKESSEKIATQAIKESTKEETKEKKEDKTEEVEDFKLFATGFHAHHWLAIFGDVEKTATKLLSLINNRSWSKDVLDKNSGMEYCPNKLHLSDGKRKRGEVMVGKLAIGCQDTAGSKSSHVYMYTILSVDPKPMIHTVYPVIISKSRKYFINVTPNLSENYVESTMSITINKTSDPGSSKPKQNIFLLASAADYPGTCEFWDSGLELEAFICGIAMWMIRNPQKSLDRKEISEGGAQSIVPDLYCEASCRTDSGYKPIPWATYKDFRGVKYNYGPRNINDDNYVQGRCVKILQYTGDCYQNNAYRVTIRLDEESITDLDLWVLGKHILDGGATKNPGEPVSIPPGTSIPEIGDLILADVWMHATIANLLEPHEPSATAVTTNTKPLIFSESLKTLPVKTEQSPAETAGFKL